MSTLHFAFSNVMLGLDNLRNELGMQSSSMTELYVYAAMIDIARLKKDREVSIDELKGHCLLQNTPKPSLYRALNQLQTAGRCAHIGSERSGKFLVKNFPA